MPPQTTSASQVMTCIAVQRFPVVQRSRVLPSADFPPAPHTRSRFAQKTLPAMSHPPAMRLPLPLRMVLPHRRRHRRQEENASSDTSRNGEFMVVNTSSKTSIPADQPPNSHI